MFVVETWGLNDLGEALSSIRTRDLRQKASSGSWLEHYAQNIKATEDLDEGANFDSRRLLLLHLLSNIYIIYIYTYSTYCIWACVNIWKSELLSCTGPAL